MTAREIKFRAWNDKISKMFFFDLEDTICTTDLKVMQFTGVKDKNGNDIYEGDIIKFHTGHKQRDSVSVKVCFNDGCFGFRGLQHDGIKTITSFIPFSVIQNSLEDMEIWKDSSEVLEIVGNIYESEIS